MGLRNNAIYILGFIVLVLYFVFSKEIWKKICLAFVASVLAITIPGKVIMSYKHITPLFQRSHWNSTAASRPHNCVRWYLDRIGIKHFFGIFPLELWKSRYTPSTVDLIKWHRDFARRHLNNIKKTFS